MNQPEQSGLGRRNLGRDKTKSIPSLGPAAPARRPTSSSKSYNLVVCGVKNASDGFIFSDFMGYCFALMEGGIFGDFYNCLPLDKHFEWLNETAPGVTSIKFGKVSTFSTEGLVTYTKQQYESRQYFWKQIGPATVCFSYLGSYSAAADESL